MCPLGKVHPRCADIGVGTMGILPHWRNYLTFNSAKRPAVGRITVEVIEALALQKMDFSLKSNPYLRATVSGYDYDLEWNLKEWQPVDRFSLNTSYCSSTLSPVWRGPGKLGGELLTLPVICTSGAILRLEAFHLDAFANASGTDPLIGVVEIPLSDIANANLRKPESWMGFKGEEYDGFVERWYHLESPPKSSETKGVVLARPIDGPLPNTHDQQLNQRRNAMTKIVHTMDELGHVAEKLCRAPVEWIGAALGIEVSRMSSDRDNRRTKSSIHIRIKLNLSEVGDLLSHSWFPPVSERPKRPPFEPDITYSRIMYISKQIAPYVRMFKFCEKCIEWKRPTMTCIYFYFGVIFHLILVQKLLLLLHAYLLIFLIVQLQRMTWKDIEVLNDTTACALESDVDGQEQLTSPNRDLTSQRTLDDQHGNQTIDQHQIQERKDAAKKLCPPSPSLANLVTHNSTQGTQTSKSEVQSKPRGVKDEEAARLNKAIVWIAKRMLSSKGMDAFQDKLGKFSAHITRLNSLWDGSSTVKTCAAIAVVAISFALHFIVNVKAFWVTVVTIAHFGPSPILQKFVRWNFGLSRGLAKVIRRRHLHLIEEEKYGKWS